MQLIIYLVLIGALVSTCYFGVLVNGQCTDGDYLVPLPKCPQNGNAPSNYSHPGDCKKYFVCSNGVPTCFECDKTLRWDQELKKCNHDSLVPCHIGSTAAPSSADVKVNCPVGYPGRIPHHNCSMYYQCANGVPITMVCGSSSEVLFFDRHRDLCNWPECVEECLEGTRPPIKTKRSTNSQSSTGRQCIPGNRN